MYSFKVNNGDLPMILFGWEIPKNAIFNEDPESPIVCLKPTRHPKDLFVWKYIKTGSKSGWKHTHVSKEIKGQLISFINKNHLEYSLIVEENPPASTLYPTRIGIEKDISATCIICGQPTFMDTSYCYNCYQQYVEKRKK